MCLEMLPNTWRCLWSTPLVLLNHQDCPKPEGPQTNIPWPRTCLENLEGTGRPPTACKHHIALARLLWLLYSIVTVAGPVSCHKPLESWVSPQPYLSRALLCATFVPRVANVVKWPTVRTALATQVTHLPFRPASGTWGNIVQKC